MYVGIIFPIMSLKKKKKHLNLIPQINLAAKTVDITCFSVIKTVGTDSILSLFFFLLMYISILSLASCFLYSLIILMRVS